MHINLAQEGRFDGQTAKEIKTDVLDKFQGVGSRYLIWVTALTVLVGLGLLGIMIRISGGFDDHSEWGYTAATLAFLVTIFAAAPIVSIGQRYIKSNWRRPITRISEIYGITGILALLLLIPLLKSLPPLEGRNNIWFDWPTFAPMGWSLIIFGSLALTGLVLLWAVALPDLAAARDHLPPSTRRRLINTLSLGWTGYLRQWRVHRWGLLTIGAIYLMLFMLVQTLISSDLSAGLLPGYKDAIFPAFQTLQGLQGSVAIVLITMFIVRNAGGYQRYIGVDQFWALSKPLLAFSLLWFYFWWSTFITLWYGRMPGEQELLKFLMFKTYLVPFLFAFFLNFLIPLLALMWNPVRKSILGPTLVAVGILIGSMFNQVRMYVSAFSVEDPTTHILEALPSVQLPDVADILIMVGAVAAPALLFMLVTKIIPVISIWDITEGLPLSQVRDYLGRKVRVIAKSH